MSSEPQNTPDERPLDFIRQIVNEDQLSGKHPVPITRFASISVSARNSTEPVICVSTIPIQAKKKMRTSNQSRRMSNGSDSTGMNIFTLHPIISISSTNLPNS
jgi:hypothetical protein